MNLNTAKTILGYLGSLLDKRLHLRRRGKTIGDIYNYLKISDTLSTSGQPTEDQLQSIQRDGFRTVINLAPHHAENALRDEASRVAELGMRYVHLPVDFKSPTDADFERFAQAMAATSGDRVWVHCAANMRVSAFVYRYRRDVLHEDEALARRDLDRIWQPSGVWQRFIAPVAEQPRASN